MLEWNVVAETSEFVSLVSDTRDRASELYAREAKVADATARRLRELQRGTQ
jgi:hypothetical protein